MYCKKCGVKIPDDSVFCYKCGTKQFDGEEKPEEKKDDTPSEPISNDYRSSASEPEEDNSGCGIIVAFFCFVVVLVGLVLAALFGSGKVGASCDGCMSSEATIQDIEVTTDLNLMELGVDVIVTPKENITGLKLKLTYYDNVDRYLNEQTFEFGDVKDGVKTKKTVSILDFSLSEAMKISKVKITVVGGTVE